jgi:predicted O-methyltransferase YrrM
MCGGGRGASLIVEVGTLGGYSAIWLARGLAPGGRVITIEMDEKHAAFAEGEFARAGVADRVQVRRGRALEVLPRALKEVGPQSVDLAFIDAAKTEYPEYFRLLRPAIRRGGLFIADNALGSNSWWIDDRPGMNADRDAVDRMNRTVAGDAEFEAVAVPMRQGVMVARRIS